MDLELSGKVALVVGGTGTLGRAIVDRLRAEGATALAASRSGSGDITLDASDQSSIDAALAQVQADHGPIDILVMTAAPPAWELDPEKLSDPDAVLGAIEGKSISFLRIANAVLPGMVERGSGRVIGIAGQKAYQSGNIAGSSRNAVLLIAAKNLADEVAGTGVTVNTINPGPVVDDPTGPVTTGEPGPSSADQNAALVAFLASGPAAAISGESISTGHRMPGLASF